MRRIILVSHCILNPYSKAQGVLNEKKLEAARKAAETLLKDFETGVIQLPCPELLYKGLNRKPASRSSYDNPEFRKICREMADQVVKLVGEYEQNDVKVIAYLGVEGSPSCGVEWTHFKDDVSEKGKGVFTEALSEAMVNAGVKVEVIGLPEDRKYGDIEETLSKLRNLNRRKTVLRM
jgi:predicted secreted protein